ncbi:MAG: VCBS repeat-containing protein [Actinobacteria bacterium]|nr:VCBS repeat-containing protein [Actinomycetota bacterium]
MQTLRFITHLFFVTTLVALSACGGGGGGGTPAAAPVSSQSANSPPVASAGANQTVGVGVTVSLDGSGSTDPNNDPLTYAWALTNDGKVSSNSSAVTITSTWILRSFTIQDSAEYYKSLCASPSVQFVIPVRLNDDNLMDFFVHYWCSAPTNGGVLTTATPDALVALVSQTDGSYKVSNEQIFGSRDYKLGGATRKYVRGDINGDGRDDFAFAMNWEDGRLAADPITNATQLSVLLSTPSGGYRVERLGKPNWNHAVEILKNADSVDVITAGFVCCNKTQAFRWRAGAFTDVSAEYDNSFSANWGSTFRAIPDAATGVAQQIVGAAKRQAINVTDYAVADIGIQLVSKKTTGMSLVSEFWRKVELIVNWTSWQQTVGKNTVISVDGKQYFGGMYDEICVMPPLHSGGSRYVVAKLGVEKDKQDRTLVAGGAYAEKDTLPVNILNFYELASSGDLKSIPSPIVNEEIASNFNFFDCKDVNNDGLPDLVSYAFSRPGFNERGTERGKPTVYINNGKDQLVKIDISALPGYSAGNELQSLMTDVNGDGITDLMLFGSATDSGGGAIEVHLLRSYLRAP